MADAVLVIGARRGPERVPVAEIRQMVGRAGRKHGGATCEAYVIVDEDEVADIENGMGRDATFDISSSMTSCDDLVFHILPEIGPRGVYDEQSAREWYSRSFGAYQKRNPDVSKTFERMLEFEAVTLTEKGYRLTDVGLIAADLYFHPADVQAWRNNFREVFEMGWEGDDGAIAWALGSVPMMQSPGDFGKFGFLLSECRDAIPDGLYIKTGTISKITLWWGALGCTPMCKMRNQMLAFRDDFGRIKRALTKLDEVEGWQMAGFFNDMEGRMGKGIPSYLADLCEIQGITKSRASYLYNMGIIDRQGIRESVSSIEGEVDEDFMRVLREIANGVR